MSDVAAAITIEALTRLDLKPSEVLAVTVGWPGLTPVQLEQYGEFLADWFDLHQMSVAGVLVLPQGSQVTAIAAPDDSGLGRCTACGLPHQECPISEPDAEWTTDANGNHEGLCCEDCQHLTETPAVDYEVPEGGVRSQYGVNFQPDEIKTVRAAADAAGKSTSAYLHDLAVEASSPVTINVTVQGSVTAERDLVTAIRDALTHQDQRCPGVHIRR